MEDFILSSVGARFKKRGVVHPFSQNAKPIPKLPHNTQKKMKKNKIKKYKKRGTTCSLSSCGLRPIGDSWLLGSCGMGPFFLYTPSSFSFFLPSYFPHVVNSFSLATIHARPA